MRLLTLIFIVIFFQSCFRNEQITLKNNCYTYPRLTVISLPSGIPKSDSSNYFCPIKNLEPNNITDSIGEYEQAWYSSTLFCFKEPILFNYYLDGEIFRFLWLRSFHQPMLFTLSNINGKVSLHIKKLDETPLFKDEKYGLPWPEIEERFKGKITEKIGDSTLVVKADRKANIIYDTTINLTSKEWNKFNSLLVQNNYWKIPVYKKIDSNDGAMWIMEAHQETCYKYVIRQSPYKEIREGGEYLIKLSGLKEEIY